MTLLHSRGLQSLRLSYAKSQKIEIEETYLIILGRDVVGTLPRKNTNRYHKPTFLETNLSLALNSHANKEKMVGNQFRFIPHVNIV